MTLYKNFNTIEIFDKNNKLIDGNTINPRDLVSIKCYIKYWRHFTSKQHKLTLELAIVKLIYQVNLIKDSYIPIELSYEHNVLKP
jgi:hypothetical protein